MQQFNETFFCRDIIYELILFIADMFSKERESTLISFL